MNTEAAERERELLADIAALTANRNDAIAERNKFLRDRQDLMAALELIAAGNAMAGRDFSSHAEVIVEYQRIAMTAIAKAKAA